MLPLRHGGHFHSSAKKHKSEQPNQYNLVGKLQANRATSFLVFS